MVGADYPAQDVDLMRFTYLTDQLSGTNGELVGEYRIAILGHPYQMETDIKDTM